MTCTRNQIRLWTVNGTLLAETDLFYSNNFRLLSCTVSELFDWDKDNVIVTGSSDGIVRVSCHGDLSVYVVRLTSRCSKTSYEGQVVN